MNIFFLHSDINKCAQYHVDKHVVKMRVELAQLASTAHWQTGSSAPYKQTHVNHPSSVWTRQSLSNYKYVVNLGLELCKEMEFRYNTKNQKAKIVLEWLNQNMPNIPDFGFTKPLLAMSKEFKIDAEIEDPMQYAIQNYTNYYKLCKKHLHSWKNRSTPQFLLS